MEKKTRTITLVRHLTLETKTCPQCGETFEGVKKRKYCRRACQAKADYDRNAETYRAKRNERYHQRQQQGEKTARKGARP